MARRGNGEGSITRRKDGRYQAALTLENHKRKYFYGKTRKEVQEKLKTALYEQQRGSLATGPHQTLEAYLERWLEQVCKRTMRLSTYITYSSNLRRHLLPALGHIKLQKLTPDALQAFYVQKQDDGLAPKSITVIHAALSGALENAMKWGFVVRNVAKLVTLPRVERYEAQILTIEQALKLLEVARGSRIETLLLVALTTGMRRGELLSLRWDDIVFEEGILSVRRTVNRLTGSSFVEGEPKTRAGRRKIAVPEVVIAALKEHREAQVQVRAKAGEKWHEQGIVFCNIYGGFLTPSRVVQYLHGLLKDAGLPHMRFHDLRHSAATFLAAARVDMKVAQERLGHGTIATTADIYTHVSPKMQQDAVEKINDLFKRP